MLSTKTITSTAGSRKSSKRLGRGNGSGKGTFSGRGMNGQNCRSWGGVPDWFEGGQTPLFRRMPKLKGFSNARYTKHFNIINVSDVEILAASGVKKINKEVLLESNVIRKKNLPVKLLGNGEIKTKCDVEVDAASASAIALVEKAGGKITLLSWDTQEMNEAPAVKEEKKEEATEKKVTTPAKKVSSVKRDDLTKIEGIGPKIAEALVNGGIVTFGDLAMSTPDAISAMITDVRGNHIPDTWPKQSTLAADGKWDELKKLQDELDGGK